MPRCPVCKSEYQTNDKDCPNCGFTEIHKEFLNQAELTRWMEDTVIPCRAVFFKMEKKYSSLSDSLSNMVVSRNALAKKEARIKLEANDVIFDDDNIKVTFMRWERKNYLAGGNAREATFLFENKADYRICIYMKDISVADFLNQAESHPFALDGHQRGITSFPFAYENKIPGNIADFDSVEFIVCYGRIKEGMCNSKMILGAPIESQTISLKL